MPPFFVDAKEIDVLRQIKSINERDYELLKKQNMELIEEKDELIKNIEQKLTEIQMTQKEKKDLQN